MALLMCLALLLLAAVATKVQDAASWEFLQQTTDFQMPLAICAGGRSGRVQQHLHRPADREVAAV